MDKEREKKEEERAERRLDQDAGKTNISMSTEIAVN